MLSKVQNWTVDGEWEYEKTAVECVKGKVGHEKALQGMRRQ